MEKKISTEGKGYGLFEAIVQEDAFTFHIFETDKHTFVGRALLKSTSDRYRKSQYLFYPDTEGSFTIPYGYSDKHLMDLWNLLFELNQQYQNL